MQEKNFIRIKKDLYEIEVNDNGDKISFDLKDISLGNKYLKAMDRVNAEQKRYNNERKNIFKKYNLNPEDIKEISISKGIGKELYQLEMNFYYAARNILDEVLGENACQKIFGDSNYPEMFTELAEALKPHFKKMQINVKSRQKELLDKYNSRNKKGNIKRVIR